MKGMATHSNLFTSGIPWTEDPGRLQPLESRRAGHNQTDLAHTHSFDCIPLFLHVLTSLIKLILWLQCFFFFFHRQKAGESYGEEGPQSPAPFQRGIGGSFGIYNKPL